MVFLGDSFVAGVGDPEHRGWVGRVAPTLISPPSRLTVYNLGVRRETSSDVLARWRGELAPRRAAGSDGRLVVSFGANDTDWENGAVRVDVDAVVSNLSLLVKQAAAEEELPVVVVGPPPVADAGHTERLLDLDARMAHVCARESVPFVSVVDALLNATAWIPECAAGDGSHPGAEGYRELAALVGPTLRDWLTPS